jgi:CHAD domain-containing protein
MKLQPDSLEKPLRKLRKQLKRLPPDPPPDDVHSLRTHTRRLEASIAAVALERQKNTRRLIKLIKPVRKAAGEVRDMDVLIGNLLTLCGDQGGEPAVRLVEHLSRMRVKNAQRLHKIVRTKGQSIRRRITQSARLIRKKLKNDNPMPESEAAPQILITELSHWPGLNTDNLHLFRIRLKELRYMLQVHERADTKLVTMLGEAKDAIGEWHDWVELEKIARRVLDPQSEGGLIKRIEQTRDEKLQIAMDAAARVRARYFSVPDGRKATHKILQMAF